jgi:hypothetical protein
MKVSLITTAALAVLLYTGPQMSTPAMAQQTSPDASGTQQAGPNSSSSTKTKHHHAAKATHQSHSTSNRPGVNNSMQDPNNQEGNGSTLGTAAKGTPDAATVGKKNPGINTNSGDPKGP